MVLKALPPVLALPADGFTGLAGEARSAFLHQQVQVRYSARYLSYWAINGIKSLAPGIGAPSPYGLLRRERAAAVLPQPGAEDALRSAGEILRVAGREHLGV